MTGEKWELLIEFSVILASPVVYKYYLWKYRNIAVQVLLKDVKIYLILYGLIAVTCLWLFFQENP
jgi:hypothetical protein